MPREQSLQIPRRREKSGNYQDRITAEQAVRQLPSIKADPYAFERKNLSQALMPPEMENGNQGDRFGSKKGYFYEENRSISGRYFIFCER